MNSIDEAEARERLDEILNAAQRQSVVIRREGRDFAIVLSVAEYERLRRDAVISFVRLRDDTAREANAAGLDEARLSKLLNDD